MLEFCHGGPGQRLAAIAFSFTPIRCQSGRARRARLRITSSAGERVFAMLDALTIEYPMLTEGKKSEENVDAGPVKGAGI